ncbi:TNF receptor-associated factor 1 [Pseudophryne corroboree]|uniref:TNF receptor-associated factor 1 n=1 Tax=Pseudophryne corroboree TaxID=495146 RepID=UPI003081D598
MAKLKSGPCSTPDENEFVSGYPTSICQDVPGNKYLCCNCNNVLKRALQTVCGHRYCSPCLSWMVRNHKRPICPRCREEDPHSLTEDSYLSEDRAFSDAAINKEISELKVHCMTAGCCWAGLLKDYDDHQSLCDYAPILCHTGCGQTVLRRHLADHLEGECTNYTTMCPRCFQRVSGSEYPDHNCEKSSSENQSHRKPDLPAKGKNHSTGDASCKCRFSLVGCNFKGSREKVKEHEKSSAAAHLELVIPVLMQIKTSLTDGGGRENGLHNNLSESAARGAQKVFSEMQNGETSLVNGTIDVDCGGHQNGWSLMPDLISRLSVLEARTQVFENIIAVLNREIDSSSAKLATVLEQRKEEEMKVKACEQKIANLNRTLTRKDIALNELYTRFTTLEQTSFDGIFLWKICDLKQKCHDAITGKAISHYSPAFYTARYGYKVCLRAYLNGDGAGKGTHISLFFAVMRGEHDALLSWPFKHKVTFMLMDQSNREHVLDAFRPDVTSASFQRPLNDMNIASGCPLFCPLSKLQSAKHSYVREDTMFIRCIIDTSS